MTGMLTDIGAYLEHQGFIGGKWPWFFGFLPADPDQAIGLFQYAGNPPTTRTGRDEPGLQVRVRGPIGIGRGASPGAYAAAERKANDIRVFLHGKGDLFLGQNSIRWIEATSSLIPLGFDSSGRPDFAANFIVAMSRIAA